MAIQLLETVTLGIGGALDVDFTNIPNDGTHLLLQASLAAPGNFDSLRMRLNNITTNSYSTVALNATSQTALNDYVDLNQTFFGYDQMLEGSNTETNAFGIYTFLFTNYTSSLKKGILTKQSNGPGENSYLLMGYSELNTTQAISSISLGQIFNEEDNLLQHSTASLYKITEEIS